MKNMAADECDAASFMNDRKEKEIRHTI